MKPSESIEPRPQWEAVDGEKGLLRNTASGRYYSRFTLGGKQRWVNHKTALLSIARRAHVQERGKIEGLRKRARNAGQTAATFGQIRAIYLERVTADASIAEKTRILKQGVVKTLFTTWPELATMRPDQLSRADVVAWRDRLAKDGTGYIPPGAKGRTRRCDGSSASRINKGIDCLRALLDIAVDHGQIAGNPLANRRDVKLPMAPKKPNLPEQAVLEEVFKDMDKRYSPSADLCRFLASTGCRLGEARGVTWQDVDFTRGILRIHGTKTDAADREVPLIPAARALLERLRQKREPNAPQTDPVLGATEAGICLARSCKNLNVPRLTHHDLRDAFATRSIESGVDIPTVAAWLGHKDGGALLMRVYAHHRRAHSLQQAAKVV